MSKIVSDEECVLCLGTGWQTEEPIVLGQNPDGTDILSEPRVSMCRCAFVERDEDEEDDEDDDSPDSPFIPGGSLVLA